MEFSRCVRPDDALGKSTMVVYFDGSDDAFSAVVYMRWQVRSGGYIAKLLTAKSKVSSMWGTSTPRVEMDAAVLAMRLAYRVVRALNMEDIPEVVWFLGDSETVLASREKESGFFGEFFGNRIGETHDIQTELQKLTKVGDDGDGKWWHVKSADNAADKSSRVDSVPSELGIGSEWQRGKDYISLDRDQWPTNRNFAERKNKVLIPKEEIVKKYRGLSTSCGHINLHDLVDHRGEEGSVLGNMFIGNKMDSMGNKKDHREAEVIGGPGSKKNHVLKMFEHGHITNDWEKLVRKTALLFRWRDTLHLKERELLSEKEQAKMFWIRVAMPATNQAGLEGKLKHLTAKKHDIHEDVIVVTGRALEGMRHYLQRDYLPVIMSSTRTAKLITLWAHNCDHAGVDITFMTTTQVAWIVGGRALARSVKRSCVRCRYLARVLEGQQMSVLPARLTVPCPVFTHVGIDLAGPFLVKKESDSRVTRGNRGTFKIWVVLFVCLSTKALKLYIAGGYSTEDFLLAWDSFVADNGEPSTCHSDRGSQLVAAAKWNPDMELPGYDWDFVATRTPKTEWFFTPAQAQFRNGGVEIFVRKFKRTLLHKFNDRKMRLLEMEAALKIVASVANSRPVSACYGPKGGDDPDYLTAITPNMLLTGRANTEVPIREYDKSSSTLTRLEYVQRVIREWWEQFKVQNFTSLIPTQRWQEPRRNMRIGDVVLVQYTSKSAPGTYRLARVISVEVDEIDKLVHTCTVLYSLLAELKPADRLKYKGVTRKQLRVPVQRLVLILPVEEVEGKDDEENQDVTGYDEEEEVSEFVDTEESDGKDVEEME